MGVQHKERRGEGTPKAGHVCPHPYCSDQEGHRHTSGEEEDNAAEAKSEWRRGKGRKWGISTVKQVWWSSSQTG